MLTVIRCFVVPCHPWQGRKIEESLFIYLKLKPVIINILDILDINYIEIS